jgi:hypothetical protein
MKPQEIKDEIAKLQNMLEEIENNSDINLKK